VLLEESLLLEEALEMGIAADTGGCAEQLAILTDVQEHCGSTAVAASRVCQASVHNTWRKADAVRSHGKVGKVSLSA
jgi:hypothetical protein